ncbi:hypothetical protein [Shewanella sp. GXUN23E]|uniref:hypothetical protein n=1 Tax=Shewanella sp. GXUN23E TaxID=3422498 RepID=UPI003D7EB6C5
MAIPAARAEPSIVLTPAQKQMMLDQWLSSLKADGAMETVAQCAGKSPGSLESELKIMFSNCLDLGMDEEANMAACVESGMSRITGMSDTELMGCLGMSSEAIALDQQLMEVEEQIDELMEIYPRTDEEEQQLQLLQEQQSRLQQQLNASGGGDVSAAEQQLAELEIAIGDNEPSPAQLAELERLQELVSQEQQRESEQILQQLKEFSQQ